MDGDAGLWTLARYREQSANLEAFRFARHPPAIELCCLNRRLW